MSSKRKEYRLTIFVSYTPKRGDTDKKIRRTLEDAAHRLAGNGMLSNGLACAIDTWSAEVKDLTPAGIPNSHDSRGARHRPG